MSNEFKKASEKKEASWKKYQPIVKERFQQFPKTRQARMAAIVAMTVAHPEGLNLTWLINRYTQAFGIKRETVVGYFKELERVGLIREKLGSIYPTERAK